mgnify:CR=1 FL=1
MKDYWKEIDGMLFNMSKYDKIQGDVTAHGKTYLSMVHDNGTEVRIAMSTENIAKTIKEIRSGK